MLNPYLPLSIIGDVNHCKPIMMPWSIKVWPAKTHLITLPRLRIAQLIHTRASAPLRVQPAPYPAPPLMQCHGGAAVVFGPGKWWVQGNVLRKIWEKWDCIGKKTSGSQPFVAPFLIDNDDLDTTRLHVDLSRNYTDCGTYDRMRI